jgi:ketosteroid isomerase-like protein
MSEENVERFREVAAAFNRITSAVDELDDDDLRSWLDFLDPEVQFEPQQSSLQGMYVWHDGARQWLADIAAHYGSGGRIEYSEIRDLGDRVLGLGTLHFKGRGSGIETEAPVAILATFRNGVICHLKDYGDEDQALKAAGLSE